MCVYRRKCLLLFFLFNFLFFIECQEFCLYPKVYKPHVKLLVSCSRCPVCCCCVPLFVDRLFCHLLSLSSLSYIFIFPSLIFHSPFLFFQTCAFKFLPFLPFLFFYEWARYSPRPVSLFANLRRMPRLYFGYMSARRLALPLINHAVYGFRPKLTIWFLENSKHKNENMSVPDSRKKKKKKEKEKIEKKFIML